MNVCFMSSQHCQSLSRLSYSVEASVLQLYQQCDSVKGNEGTDRGALFVKHTPAAVKRLKHLVI